MDQFWQDAAAQVNLCTGMDRVVGPKEMGGAIPQLFLPYEPSLGLFTSKDVLVLHKDVPNEIDRTFLAQALVIGRAFFANEVFIVLAGTDVKAPEPNAGIVDHIGSLGNALKPLPLAENASISKARMNAYLGKGTLLTKLYDGQKIFLDGDDISLTPHLTSDGFWEMWITDVFLERVKPGMHVLDIGANCGYYSLLAAKAVGSTGSVTSIDANPRMCELVEKSNNTNGYSGYTRVINSAVMEQPGDIEFAIPKKFKGSASYMREGLDYSNFGETYDIIKVYGAPLRELTGDAVFDVVKIDAEGAEPLIYKGARDFLKTMPGVEVIMEFTPEIFEKGISGSEFLDMLEGDGFEISAISHQSKIVPASRDELLSGKWPDLFLKLKK